mgnify:FL=1
MEQSQIKPHDNNKMKLIKKLLQKQVLNDEKRNTILNILTYLEHEQFNNKDDIHLKNEIKALYCIL